MTEKKCWICRRTAKQVVDDCLKYQIPYEPICDEVNEKDALKVALVEVEDGFPICAICDFILYCSTINTVKVENEVGGLDLVTFDDLENFRFEIVPTSMEREEKES